MPEWLSILLGILGGVGTVAGILGISAYFSERTKHKVKKKIEQEEKQMLELEEWRHQTLVDELREIIKEEVSDIASNICNIKLDLEQNKRATITSLRASMKELRDKYKAQGYADAGDKATWNELFDDYKDMGGNHFKEYVNQWKKEVNDLPLEKITHRKQSSNNKQILVEKR